MSVPSSSGYSVSPSAGGHALEAASAAERQARVNGATGGFCGALTPGSGTGGSSSRPARRSAAGTGRTRRRTRGAVLGVHASTRCRSRRRSAPGPGSSGNGTRPAGSRSVMNRPTLIASPPRGLEVGDDPVDAQHEVGRVVHVAEAVVGHRLEAAVPASQEPEKPWTGWSAKGGVTPLTGSGRTANRARPGHERQRGQHGPPLQDGLGAGPAAAGPASERAGEDAWCHGRAACAGVGARVLGAGDRGGCGGIGEHQLRIEGEREVPAACSSFPIGGVAGRSCNEAWRMRDVSLHRAVAGRADVTKRAVRCSRLPLAPRQLALPLNAPLKFARPCANTASRATPARAGTRPPRTRSPRRRRHRRPSTTPRARRSGASASGPRA